MQIGHWVVRDDDPAAEPVVIVGSESLDDAAAMFAQQEIERTEGAWTEGAVRVWGATGNRESATLFTIVSHFIVSPTDENEVDCEVQVFEGTLDL